MMKYSIRLRFGSLVASVATIAGFALVTAHPVQHNVPSPAGLRAISQMTDGQTPLVGSADAPIKVIGAIDYACPACRAHFQEVVDQAARTKKTAFYVEQFPLPYHPLARPAATLALNSEKAGNYRAVHHALLAGKEMNQGLLNKVSAKFHLSQKPSAEITKALDQNLEEFKKMGVSSVPSFIISDGEEVQVYSWSDAVRKLGG